MTGILHWMVKNIFTAQPVVQATTTVYTLPSSDPRYPGTNVSTSLRHVYGKFLKNNLINQWN